MVSVFREEGKQQRGKEGKEGEGGGRRWKEGEGGRRRMKEGEGEGRGWRGSYQRRSSLFPVCLRHEEGFPLIGREGGMSCEV